MDVRWHWCWQLTHSTWPGLTPASDFLWRVPSGLSFSPTPRDWCSREGQTDRQEVLGSPPPQKETSWNKFECAAQVSQGPQPLGTLGTESSRPLFLPLLDPPSFSYRSSLCRLSKSTTWAFALQSGEPQLKEAHSVPCSALRHTGIKGTVETYPGCLHFQVLKHSIFSDIFGKQPFNTHVWAVDSDWRETIDVAEHQVGRPGQSGMSTAGGP